MSLVVAVHNNSDIVIAWDKQSRYIKAGRAFMPEEEAEKVSKVHDRLALMVTGSYNSDKLTLLADFKRHQAHAPLDQAFKALFVLGDKMVLRPNERGVMIGLAGYIAGKPTFRFFQRIYGDPTLSHVQDYPINYYLNGILLHHLALVLPHALDVGAPVNRPEFACGTGEDVPPEVQLDGTGKPVDVCVFGPGECRWRPQGWVVRSKVERRVLAHANACREPGAIPRPQCIGRSCVVIKQGGHTVGDAGCGERLDRRHQSAGAALRPLAEVHESYEVN